MALLNILHYPDERLRQAAKPITQIDAILKKQILDMIETMHEARGIGLAATQVNIHQRFFVMDITQQKGQAMVFINPVITEREGQTIYEEGCLSVPGIFGLVKRAENITVEAMDKSGQKFIFHATGLAAICIQHEIDHLDGKVFIEYLSPLKQQRALRKLEKLRERNIV